VVFQLVAMSVEFEVVAGSTACSFGCHLTHCVLFVTELKIKNPNYVYCQLIIWSIYVSELLETLVPRTGIIVSSHMYLCANALEGSDPPPSTVKLLNKISYSL
jgi:hypothetical protein